MLNAIFRCVSGLAYPDLCALFVRQLIPNGYLNTRKTGKAHSVQLADPIDDSQNNFLAISVRRTISVWNALPRKIMRIPSVKEFQRRLTLFFLQPS